MAPPISTTGVRILHFCDVILIIILIINQGLEIKGQAETSLDQVQPNPEDAAHTFLPSYLSSEAHPKWTPSLNSSGLDDGVLRDNEELRPTANSFQTFLGNGSTRWHSTTLTSGMAGDLAHECYRECGPRMEKKQCHYVFKVEWYVSMSKACFACPHVGPDCSRPHCVPTDGFERPLVTVNRRMPGPSIQVCEGDEIVVDVKNELGSDSTSVHWHGLHQVGTPYMDGVPFLTQCPIHPGTTFRYHFIADLPGTHYWHSHSGFQRADGMYGSVVVRARSDPHASLYDVDDPNHVVILTDWLERLGIDKFVNHHHTEHDNKPYSILMNGLGKYLPLEEGGSRAHTPLFEYRVKQGLRYRFRSSSNSIQNCPIEISIDNHTLLVIASDAHNIQPLEVESLVIYGGERWDFVVGADQPAAVYWVKFKGLLDCDDRFKSAHQVALLRYEGVEGGPATPPEEIDYDATNREGKQLNTLNAAPGDLVTFFTSADIRAYNDVSDDDVTVHDVTQDGGTQDGGDKVTLEQHQYTGEPDQTFWLDFDFQSRDNEAFHHPDLYSFFGVVKKKRLYTPQINNISLMLPNVPPLSQPDQFDQSLVCNASSRSDCGEHFCHCTHMLSVKLGSLVELILIDTGVVYWANHPFHLHGHAFAVLGMGRLGEQTTVEAVRKLEREGELQRNFIDPPIKDTVTIPDGGYTVVRFRANNPGYWLFHCHITFHVETGMALVFHVGEKKHIPPVPKGFPKCGSWVPEISEDLEQQVSRWKNNTINAELLKPHKKSHEYITFKTKESPEPNRRKRQRASEGSRSFQLSPYLLSITIILTISAR